jgi:GMP synthase (glutamine-hydrolysing)
VSTRLLVVQHQDMCPPGLLTTWCAAGGVELDVVRPDRGEMLPATPLGWQGLLVLGGEMGALDDDIAPWLPGVRRLIAASVEEGTPFLGVCLGHQLAGAALGGVVTRNPAGRSQGVTPFGPLDAGRQDPLVSAVAPGSPVVQSNSDIVAELPAGAVALARSPDGAVQAARFAPLAWGVQCHPEATAQIFRWWTVEKPSALQRDDGIDLHAAARDVAAREAEMAEAWEPFGRRFARVVAEHADR